MTDILEFIDASPSPYHVVTALRGRLDEAGFTYLPEAENWVLAPGGSYYTLRGGKTIIAWRRGTAPVEKAGFRILAAHTDSPCLKVKANPLLVSGKSRLLSIDVYGSPLLHSWLDRDLKLSGTVYTTGDSPGAIIANLVDLARLPVRAPSLAIHLNRGLRTDGLKINPQTDLNLIFAQSGSEPVDLPAILAKGLDGDPARIAGWDLCTADSQPSGRIGFEAEFLSAPRLDNLFSCHCIAEALLGLASPTDQTTVAAWFDAEEVGSRTSDGAGSNLLDATLLRIALAQQGGGLPDFYRAKSQSVILSADMAHAEHPAFKDRTDENHVPVLNGGLALKSSADAKYGHGSDLAAWLTNACRTRDIPLQRFSYRCDHGGGSSIGPIVSSLTGIRTIDAGAPMLSMHSIRELAGSKDEALCVDAFSVFLTGEMLLAYG